mmetsp:Transcript_57765/g.181095  ORF Transcript_57765/g.181095 Transcript_57765/m.181095 type:complete len:253 (+) Transcript_57765:90-848(+)
MKGCGVPSEAIQLHKLLCKTRERGRQGLNDVRAEYGQDRADRANHDDHARRLTEALLEFLLGQVEEEWAHDLLEELRVLGGARLVQFEERKAAAVRPHELLELVRPEGLILLHLLSDINLQRVPNVHRLCLALGDLLGREANDFALGLLRLRRFHGHLCGFLLDSGQANPGSHPAGHSQARCAWPQGRRAGGQEGEGLTGQAEREQQRQRCGGEGKKRPPLGCASAGPAGESHGQEVAGHGLRDRGRGVARA